MGVSEMGLSKLGTIKLKYPNGKTIPDNVYQAVEFAGKIGFLSRELWSELFSSGGKRWQGQQLKKVVQAKLLMPYPNSALRDYYCLTKASRNLLENLNLCVLNPVNSNQLEHDGLVARSMWRLSKLGLITRWRVEAELKREQVREYQLSRDVRNKKYPDAVFKMKVFGEERTIALEYERTMKSAGRYRDALWLYSKMNSFAMILFVCENLAIENALKRRLQYMKLPDLWGRVAFAKVSDWRENPSEAPIGLGDKIVRLKDLGKNKCDNSKASEQDQVIAYVI